MEIGGREVEMVGGREAERMVGWRVFVRWRVGVWRVLKAEMREDKREGGRWGLEVLVV